MLTGMCVSGGPHPLQEGTQGGYGPRMVGHTAKSCKDVNASRTEVRMGGLGFGFPSCSRCFASEQLSSYSVGVLNAIYSSFIWELSMMSCMFVTVRVFTYMCIVSVFKE